MYDKIHYKKKKKKRKKENENPKKKKKKKNKGEYFSLWFRFEILFLG